MKDAEFKIWCSLIPKLTTEQRLTATVQLRLLSDAKPDTNDWLFNGLYLSLQRHGLLDPLSLRTLRQTKAVAHYNKHAEAIKQSLLELIADIPSSRFAKAALALAVGDALIAWCKYRHHTISASLILNNCTHALDALNRAFPGYLQAGLLGAAIVAPARMFDKRANESQP